jgi:hypothetical protein
MFQGKHCLTTSLASMLSVQFSLQDRPQELQDITMTSADTEQACTPMQLPASREKTHHQPSIISEEAAQAERLAFQTSAAQTQEAISIPVAREMSLEVLDSTAQLMSNCIIQAPASDGDRTYQPVSSKDLLDTLVLHSTESQLKDVPKQWRLATREKQEELTEVVFRVQGILCDKDLPPLNKPMG